VSNAIKAAEEKGHLVRARLATQLGARLETPAV
jgi:hypothetical protein